MKLWIIAITAALLAAVGAQTAPAAAPSETPNASWPTDEVDFDRYQRGLISLNRRIDAVEATLGGLVAVEIAALTYILEKVDKLPGNELWTRLALLGLILPIVLGLAGVFAFQGEETPNLAVYARKRPLDRSKAVADGIQTMVESYDFNKRQLALKELLRKWSVGLTAVTVAFVLAHVLGLV